MMVTYNKHIDVPSFPKETSFKQVFLAIIWIYTVVVVALTGLFTLHPALLSARQLRMMTYINKARNVCKLKTKAKCSTNNN